MPTKKEAVKGECSGVQISAESKRIVANHRTMFSAAPRHTPADHVRGEWRKDVVEVTAELAPLLYRRHVGTTAVRIVGMPDGLDVTASREGTTLFLHVVSTKSAEAVPPRIVVEGCCIRTARSFEIAAPPELEIVDHNAAALAPIEKAMPQDLKWTFPAASVSAVEIRT